ncbi:hypothetical protein GGQ84_000083 [Desulfitispora alkaliphila]|uniref:vitamin B12 dependent-methionine synthase activation domain-containing protein n=1 Tax=Desulfitispora alkaliphila TaxID=622674 RepID=UPI003D250CBE
MEINRDEVLRYLGYKGQTIDYNLELVIQSCIEEIKLISKPRYHYGIYKLEKGREEVTLTDSNINLEGNSIREYLAQVEKCVVLAATLGAEVDRKIRQYQLTDMTRAAILDACATEAIEALCNQVEQEIKKVVKGSHLTSRYSPGYGDLPLELQGQILKELKAYQKIGLAITSSHLLTPRKSVTAIIGLSEKPLAVKKKKCVDCTAYNYCSYRKEEGTCGAL